MPTPATPVPVVPAVTPAEPTQRAPAPPADAGAERVNELDQERLARQVFAVCPPDLKTFAHGLLLQPGASYETVRAGLLAEMTKRAAPVGTPEPAPVQTTAAPKVDVPDDVLLRSLCNPRF